MLQPLVNLQFLDDPKVGPVLAVECRQQGRRETPTHRHTAGQLLGSVSGLVSITTLDGTFVVPSTHAIWIPPRHEHALRSSDPFHGWSVYVAEAASADLPGKPKTLQVTGLLREVIRRALSWQRPPARPDERRLAEVILDEIAALPEVPLGLPSPRDSRLQKVTAALLNDLADERGLDAWADLAGLSARTLSRRFVSETGFTFTAWRQRARVLRAIERLAEGASVTTVALELGYENVSAFIAMFSRTCGTTPGRYEASSPLRAEAERI